MNVIINLCKACQVQPYHTLSRLKQMPRRICSFYLTQDWPKHTHTTVCTSEFITAVTRAPYLNTALDGGPAVTCFVSQTLSTPELIVWRRLVEMDELQWDNGFKQKRSWAREHLERHREDKLDMTQQHLHIVKRRGFAFLEHWFLRLNSRYMCRWMWNR